MGTKFGEGLYGFAFRANGSSKQTDMCASPKTGRIYTQGGDTLGSATDGTWSFLPDFTDIRLEVGVPIFPSLPAPHSLQDDYGFEWDELTEQLFLWPGGYFAYQPAGSPIENYTGGCWWFDPVTKIYTQDNRLFPNTPETINGVLIAPGHTAPGIGCPNGGFFDHVKRQFGIVTDSTSQPGVQLYDLATMTRLPFQPINIAPSPDYQSDNVRSFVRTKYVTVGRKVYFVGKTTKDGVTWHAGFWSLDLDTHIIDTLATPRDANGNPVVMASDLDTQLNKSHGKVVWLVFDGPDGTVRCILLYDIPSNSWAEDTQARPDGFWGNVSLSLTDERIILAGGVFRDTNPQQSHFNWYEAAH